MHGQTLIEAHTYSELHWEVPNETLNKCELHKIICWELNPSCENGKHFVKF